MRPKTLVAQHDRSRRELSGLVQRRRSPDDHQPSNVESLDRDIVDDEDYSSSRSSSSNIDYDDDIGRSRSSSGEACFLSLSPEIRREGEDSKRQSTSPNSSYIRDTNLDNIRGENYHNDIRKCLHPGDQVNIILILVLFLTACQPPSHFQTLPTTGAPYCSSYSSSYSSSFSSSQWSAAVVLNCLQPVSSCRYFSANLYRQREIAAPFTS